MSAYYNENNPKAAAWLRELIRAGYIAPGIVDQRSIVDVRGADLAGYHQVHLFAGIGGWSLALRLAGWPDDRPVWTGSCPCQPFSCAGKRKATRDPRHLWPQMLRLVAERHPPVIFGEQVASKAGRLWLSRVRANLETLAYAFGAADLCAAGISAPMVSQRLHWVATADGFRGKEGDSTNGAPTPTLHAHEPGQDIDGVAAPEFAERAESNSPPLEPEQQASRWSDASRSSDVSARLAEANGCHSHWWSGPLQVGRNCIESEIERGGRKHRAQWRIKPGLPLLADGIPGRVAQLCGFGNAIVPQLAAEFIGAYLGLDAQ